MTQFRRCDSLACLVCAVALVAVSCIAVPARATSSFTLFETGQVRPLAMSPNNKFLFALNTPDNRLEIYRITPAGLAHRGAVSVGLEPVAVAARTNHEVWVVNHLSDSVSVVALEDGARAGRVVRTLLVGDEPRDIVFAGPQHRRAFITTAHRGQNVPYDPQLTTPGIGRADVWVFDAQHLGGTLTGTPLTILTLFTDTPRALAATADGTRVYAAGFHTGNQTTSIFRNLSTQGPGRPPPHTNVEGIPAPLLSLILKFDGTHWVDELGGIWDDHIRFSLPDTDVFAIDAMAHPPHLLPDVGGTFTGVGTILFNMAVNPVSGTVYVSNLESLNQGRFEGAGEFAGTTVRGHIAESRITVLTPAGGVAPRHLNKHIDYTTCCAPIPNRENQTSLAFPLDMAVSRNGKWLYVAALGSSEVGVYRTAHLENDTFTPRVQDQIPVTGGGPTGLALDEERNRLYVLTRFDNAISVIDTRARTEIAHYPMFTPEPPSIVRGRRFLYDASFTSSHGDSACASCHLFGDLDSLAWELGDPDETTLPNPGPFVLPPPSLVFHPIKGPMTTQSLRGLANHGPMHWRGDRTGGNHEPSAQPDSGTFDEAVAFTQFNPAFWSLLGRDQELTAAEMQTFTDFILQLTYPPNPIRALDNALTPAQQAGRDAYFNGPGSILITQLNCIGCHTLDPAANPDADAPGFFGADGRSNADFGAGSMKIPHLRNLYQKVGMFGMADIPGIHNPGGDFHHQGDQIRGFGFLNDGSVDTVFRFMSTIGFTASPANPGGFPLTPAGDVMRRNVEAFVLAYESNLQPIVGQQTTLTGANARAVGPRLDLLIARASVGDCELMAKLLDRDDEQGLLYLPAIGKFQPNRQHQPAVSDAALRAWADDDGDEITYTCVPPGSGLRIALDRDEDGYRDGDEIDAGSDPADPASTP
jgi:DNA-binding beta-propeller fold protein YncE